jgi:predicted RNA-binding protein
MRNLVREARSSVRKTQIDQGILDKMEIQKDNIMKAIKRIPELKEYAFPDIKERVKGTQDQHDGSTDLEIEKRDARSVVCVVEEPQPESEKSRKPKKNQIKRTYFITVNGKKFKVEHSFVDLKTDHVLKDKTVDDEKGIQVFTNTAFPGFAVSKDHVFYGTWNIAEAIAEVMVERNQKSADEVLKIRDSILRKSAEITRELDEVEQEKKLAEKLRKEYETKMARIKEIEAKNVDLSV